jgi:outer membrane murein-binding lipoprotein Lpp
MMKQKILWLAVLGSLLLTGCLPSGQNNNSKK